ncbi:MAG: DUF6460 domain-containing protein [Alphaproteobacteria bacterium]|nr:DUF6460 domain-containing protein [Rhodospirillales bacterium]MCW9046088.1 DUF6460 domain-containing protein [Alphaproteobacteria bacterium]
MESKRVGPTIIRLIIMSLVVGIMLKFFNVDPQNLLASIGRLFEKVIEIGAKLVEWGFDYVILGAAVVIPIWLVMFLIRYAKAKK